jgi:PilZ domain-containing protein
VTSDSEWSSASIEDKPLRRNRFPLMRPVSYELSASLSEAGAVRGLIGTGLSINVSSGGMCLLMDWAPGLQEVLRVHVPMEVFLAKTPTLAEVCWKRPVPLGREGLYFVGMKFVL